MKKCGSCLFHNSAIHVLHTFLLLHVGWDEAALVHKPLKIYIVSNRWPPFNLTAAAEVLIVITCNVSMNMCTCDEGTCVLFIASVNMCN